MKISSKSWKENSSVIHQFTELKDSHEKLCSEVAYILDNQIKKSEIKVAHISHRAKTLDSFLEKIDRKSYLNPLDEIQDLAGVRLVYLYSSDIEKIKSIITTNFEIIEVVNQQEKYEHDQFGYSAIHYIVKLGGTHSGARYDDLKKRVCEIQIRTVLQDAWSIVSHHLLYKRENQIPSQFKRKVHSLAGLFEIADDQFDSIRDLQGQYLIDVADSLEKHELNQELNGDSIYGYVKWKYPDLKIEAYNGHLRFIASDFKLKTLKELDELILKASPAIDDIKVHLGEYLSATGIIAYVYAMEDQDWVEEDEVWDEVSGQDINPDWDPEDLELIDKLRELIS